MNNKMNNRGLQLALSAANLSTLRSHRVGAALYYKKKLLNIGFNQKKTHPLCNTERTQHAEFNVCLGFDKIKTKPSKCSLYIARLTRTDNIGLAKPCEYCQDFLAVLGITKIFYTNEDGGISKL